ncbi:hypothetical protein ISF_07319 [Cordyceps fumosorosea ARSEF 2679]|uniref:Uncharacterized protein n=1 Tax=Cordyceps fumosorosea (strain ARSEF 2679) TaxID=1081104 RepID=A0A167PM11_CORFA|nr:hypothetical protein ISF_07319 [Cordyceps fumosorosea ARSEF 2679]OAA56803.1 hypothetical protein ISF_07319 [Cordyceps fumosorosea ARSEF 2679]
MQDAFYGDGVAGVAAVLGAFDADVSAAGAECGMPAVKGQRALRVHGAVGGCGGVGAVGDEAVEVGRGRGGGERGSGEDSEELQMGC